MFEKSSTFLLKEVRDSYKEFGNKIYFVGHRTFSLAYFKANYQKKLL